VVNGLDRQYGAEWEGAYRLTGWSTSYSGSTTAPGRFTMHRSWRRVLALRIDAVDVAHQARQGGLAGLKDEVNVITHEAAGPHPGAKARKTLFDHRQEHAAVVVVFEDRSRRSPREVAS